LFSLKKLNKLVLYVLVVIGFSWGTAVFNAFENGIFWDLGIYAKAINILNSGGDPYSPDQLRSYLSFVYHPLVLHVMALFGSWLSLALMAFYIASIVYFLLGLRKKVIYGYPHF
jgi:hypothetical protein